MRAHSIEDGEHLITCWCHYEQKQAMSDHAAVKEEHRKLLNDVFNAVCSIIHDPTGPERAVQLLADFARDERFKEAQLWKDRWHMTDAEVDWRRERIAQLKRGAL